MQVIVDSKEIAALEERATQLLGLVRALAVKHAVKGVVRLTNPELIKAENFSLEVKQLKGSVKLTVVLREE